MVPYYIIMWSTKTVVKEDECSQLTVQFVSAMVADMKDMQSLVGYEAHEEPYIKQISSNH